MIAPRLLGSQSAAARPRLNRTASPLVAYFTPWFTIVLASTMPGWAYIASSPLMPPLGFLMLLAWRQLNPGLLPVWAGLPLGLIDDLFSGQPPGSGVLLWSVAVLGLELVEMRWPWRNFLVEWMVSGTIIAVYLLFAGVIANGRNPPDWLALMPPQILISILVYPLIGRLVARCDRWRLTPFRIVR